MFRIFFPCILFLSLMSGAIMAQGRPQGPGNGQGQPRQAEGIISGMVVDKDSDVPVEYANVVLFRAKDSVMVTGVVTDKKGKFRLTEVPNGSYMIKVLFMGFRTNTVRGIVIKPESYVKEVGEIKLEATATNLGGVTISEKKEQMEFNLDKKVINVDKNIMVSGGTAIDIMQTIPAVSVDVEGTVSLRGSSNVTILIDGRPSGFTSLDQLPAAMIDRVEIVTNPSARYDPEGTSGIINIVLKKKREPGYNGLVSLNVGTGDKYMGSVNLNYRYYKINVFAYYDLRYFGMKGFTDFYRQSWLGDTTYLDQESRSYRHGNFHNIRGGMDYFIDHFNTLSVSGRYRIRIFETSDLLKNTQSDQDYNPSKYYERTVESESGGNGYEVSLNYKRTFEKKGREWTMDASFEDDKSLAEQDMSQQYYDSYLNYEGLALLQKSNTDDKGYEGLFQTDYVHPLSKGRIETGYKYTIDRDDQDYRFSDLDEMTSEWVLDTFTSNRFVYTRHIHAAYFIYSNTIKKFYYQAGVRFEEALSTGDQVTIGEKYTSDKFSFFPSAHLKYQFNEMHSVKLSYSRRVNRPRVRHLNPFTNYSDPLNLSTGNPYLKPEYTNSLELGYDLSYKGADITPSVFFRQTSGIISRIVTLDSNGVSSTTYENLNNGTSFGIEMIYAQKLFKWWKFNLNGSYFKQEYAGDQVNTNARSSYSWNAKFTSSFSILKDFDIQASFIYNSPVVTASGGGDRFFASGGSQGKMQQNYWADIGMKKDFLKGALSLSLRVSDIFKTQRYDVDSWGDYFVSTTKRYRDSRMVFFGMTYKINGGIKKKQRGEDMDFEMDY